MAISLNESRPIGLCVATEELFDTKRFLLNYCDGLILKQQDRHLKGDLISVKRELNSFRSQPKFFHGYKAVIISNMDKIIGLVTSRFPSSRFPQSDAIVNDAKDLISKTIKAETFEDVSELEMVFRSKITLPTYKLFVSNLKRSEAKGL